MQIVIPEKHCTYIYIVTDLIGHAPGVPGGDSVRGDLVQQHTQGG